ncbi:hypothetical protein FFLO_06713 [Filobasidium floriforme]|uniref:Uncharacterized protein n=1 Tax=Filobasidium floriforme TaxID=5210 RepID=A0A8K0JEC8_9TREE|nr:uncharacterized protein HD553DRAFT_320780 [Filobasidium floriforme]KAG7527651.1 hypothetical protein FFLO_06713 [Filobasidium floriforme]KAH8077456.1 hypothetical protein HD553DRAFT_320780 [Filobasidium floriforme]
MDNGKKGRALWTKTQETDKLTNDLEKVQAEKQTSAEALRKKTEWMEKLTNDLETTSSRKGHLDRSHLQSCSTTFSAISELEQLWTEVGLMRENMPLSVLDDCFTPLCMRYHSVFFVCRPATWVRGSRGRTERFSSYPRDEPTSRFAILSR